MELLFTLHYHYGNLRFYPDTKEATAIVHVSGRRTLTYEHLDWLQEAGFSVTVQDDMHGAQPVRLTWPELRKDLQRREFIPA